MSAVNVSAVVAAIAVQATAVGAVGGAVLLVYVGIRAFRFLVVVVGGSASVGGGGLFEETAEHKAAAARAWRELDNQRHEFWAEVDRREQQALVDGSAPASGGSAEHAPFGYDDDRAEEMAHFQAERDARWAGR